MSADVTDPKNRSRELLSQMAGGKLYRKAYSEGLSLSAWLEKQDRSTDHPDSKLDAFERLVQAAGIITTSDPDRGFYADQFEAFDKDDNTRALVPEWIARQWRRVATGRTASTRGVYNSAANGVGSLANPWTDAADARGLQIAPAIPLSELVAVTTPITGDAYRAFYLENVSVDELRMKRVVEGAEIPRARLVGGEHTIRLSKFGRVLEVTYEILRRQRIDLVAIHIARMAVQAEIDRVAAAMDILVNGDGNANTAATSYNLTTLDSGASVNALTLKAWLAFKLKFQNPYFATTVLAQDAPALQLLLLSTGSSNIPLVSIAGASGFGGFTPINPALNAALRLGYTADAPANKIVAFDRRFAIERVVEVGSDISEIERWTTRQTQTLTMSEVEGYAVLDGQATKVLNLAA